ncbi:MAG: DUF1127 domain-containing protein [Pseudomonadota bacterium]
MDVTRVSPELPLGAITIHRIVKAVTVLRENLVARISRQRTLRTLNALNDRQLEDIGLTRADIAMSMEKGF